MSSHRSIRFPAVALIVVIDAAILASVVAMGGSGVYRAALFLVLGWTMVLALAVWRLRTWAQIATLLTFGPIAIVALALSIDVVRRVQSFPADAPPRVHLIAPAIVTVCAGALVAIVSAARRSADVDGQGDMGVSG